MFRNGMFIDLGWDSIEQKHRNRWEILERRYGVSASTDTAWLQERREVSGNGENLLDNIAKACIDQCSKYLFCKPPDMESEAINGWKIKNYYVEEQDLSHRFSLGLCDHLIVTFAYRFYYDNLKIPGDIKSINLECRRRILQCQTKPTNMGNFHTAKASSWEAFCEDICELIKWYDSRRIDKPGKGIFPFAGIDSWKNISIDDELLRAPNWLFSWVLSTQRGMRPYKLSKDKKRLSFENPQDEKKEDGLSGRLRNFLAGRGYAPLIMTTHNLPIKPKIERKRKEFNITLEPEIPMTSRTLPLGAERDEVTNILYENEYTSARAEILSCKNEFVGVAWEREHFIEKRMPAQTYERVDGKGKVVIAEEVQDVLNSYLLERYFHGYAIAMLQKCLLGQNYSNWEYYIGLAQIARLQAPLLHAQMIAFSYQQSMQIPFTADKTAWLTDYITYWNETALPVLEELFIWSIYKVFGENQEALIDSIEASFFSGEEYARRSDRLRIYRLVPCNEVDKPLKMPRNVIESSEEGKYYKKKREEKAMLDKCVQEIYYNAIGCVFKNKDMIYIERATAFDEVDTNSDEMCP